MKQTITVQVEIEFEGEYCSENCEFKQLGTCILFKKYIDRKDKESMYGIRIRCSECLDACKENN